MKLYAPAIVLLLWGGFIAAGLGTNVIWAVLLVVATWVHIQAERERRHH